MDFVKGKRSVALLLAGTVLFFILSKILSIHESRFAASCTVLGAACFMMAINCDFKWCRCPYCKKTIFAQLFFAKKCPYCEHELPTRDHPVYVDFIPKDADIPHKNHKPQRHKKPSGEDTRNYGKPKKK
ncbi:MAG: hypothetical protein IJG63_00270 [Oscillospiraceae bacterium]|nr:hypothetical protein [Oscillospiraceae bacterium]